MYELVYGHRRIRAAKILNWPIISCDVVSYSDEQMLQCSFAENISREDLSDYEIALNLQRLHKDFGKTYDEIGLLFGYSKAHVCNYIRMLHLFDEQTLADDPVLTSCLYKIREHHARLLHQIQDTETRKKTLKLVVSEGLAVKDLEHIILRLRSWFQAPQENAMGPDNSQLSEDISKIESMLGRIYTLPGVGDINSYLDFFKSSDLSMFTSLPPLERLDAATAFNNEKKWFRLIRHLSATLRDIQVKIIDNVAIATLYVDYAGKVDGSNIEMSTRGTTVFAKRDDHWQIIHAHWSKLENQRVKEGMKTMSLLA